MKLITIFIFVLAFTMLVSLTLIVIIGPFLYSLVWAIESGNGWILILGICWHGGWVIMSSYYEKQILGFFGVKINGWDIE